jgi:hypothetical protein
MVRKIVSASTQKAAAAHSQGKNDVAEGQQTGNMSSTY